MAKGRDVQETRWLALIASLPVEDPASRMRVLRTLESLGCAMLREGVYLLPDTAENLQSLQRLCEHITRLNGSAHSVRLEALDGTQAQKFRGYFDRSAQYEELAKNVESLKAGFGISDPVSIARVLAKQKRDFETISSIDFFSSPSRERAERALQELESSIRLLMFPDTEPKSRRADEERAYFNRIWATRKPLWADRLACGWLIRRFIDPEGTLIWMEKNGECPPGAVGFGYEGATFANSKSQVTFEQFLHSFGLNKNKTLARLGALVHCLETGGAPVPEAAGVETLLQGAKRRSKTDGELFSESEKTFDLLYDAYSE